MLTIYHDAEKPHGKKEEKLPFKPVRLCLECTSSERVKKCATSLGIQNEEDFRLEKGEGLVPGVKEEGAERD